MNKHTSSKKDEWTKFSTVMIISAFVLVLFSFVAPILFTRGSICGRISFSETGQIGDTIGGLMNPFIALSGVIMTFVAFYIQKKTNDKLWEKTERQETNRVEDGFLLIQEDLAYMYKEINGIDTSFHNFIQTFYKQKQFNEWDNTLGHFSASMYKRMAEENRSNMMHILSSKGVANPSTFLYGYYALADYFSENFGYTFKNAVENINDIIEVLKDFPSTIETLSVVMNRYPKSQTIENRQLFVEEYDNWKYSGERNIRDFIHTLLPILENIEKEINEHKTHYVLVGQTCAMDEYNSLEKVRECLIKSLEVCRKISPLFETMGKHRREMGYKIDDCLGQISKLLDQLSEVQSSFEN